MVTPLPNVLVVGAGVEGWHGWGLKVGSGGWCKNPDIVTLYIRSHVSVISNSFFTIHLLFGIIQCVKRLSVCSVCTQKDI